MYKSKIKFRSNLKDILVSVRARQEDAKVNGASRTRINRLARLSGMIHAEAYINHEVYPNFWG